MKTVVLVIGPESSGTRMMTDLFVRQGYFGDAEDPQRIDAMLREKDKAIEEPLVVIRRSQPHGEDWVDCLELLWRFQVRGYRPVAVVTARDPYCMARSQSDGKKHSFSMGHAMAKIQRAYSSVLRDLSCSIPSIPFALVPYEALVLHGHRVMTGVFKLLDLPEYSMEKSTGTPIRDENIKHYVGAF